MNEAIDSRERHGGIGKNTRPVAEGLVRSHQQAAAFVAGSNHLEQDAGFCLVTANVAKIVENDQLVLVELLDGALENQGSGVRSAGAGPDRWRG